MECQNVAMKLYHNPRCSKSRQALALLEARGLAPEVIRYLEQPPDAATLDGICKALNAEPAALVRFKDEAARQLGLKADDARPREAWLARGGRPSAGSRTLPDLMSLAPVSPA